MVRTRIAVCCCLVAFAVLLAPGSAQATPGSDLMVKKINEYRKAHGLRPLRRSRSLQRSSFLYSRWQMRADYFGHLGRIRASRRFRWLGEVVAMHSGLRLKVRGTLRQWIRSSGHRRILLSHRYRYVGAGHRRGYFRGRRATIWTAQFGR